MLIIIATGSAVILTAGICTAIFCIRQKRINLAVGNEKEKYSILEKELSDCKSEVDVKSAEITELQKKTSELQEKYDEEHIISEQKTNELKDTLQALENAKIDIQNQNDKIKFIADIINAQPVELPPMQEFKTLLATDYREYAKNNDSLADEAGALLKLQEVEQQLELFSYDEAIAKKTVVAVAGSFSSGKSSFMNSFFPSRDVKLPTGMTQTTAISSYVLADETASITGYSYKGGRVSIPEKIFSLFSHEKMQEFNFNMKQLIHNIIFKNKFVHEFKNLCFIDTPGFNPGTEQQSDYDSATTAISTASALIWCIDSQAGTINDDEVDILYDIYRKNENISIYIVVNKADLRSVEEIEVIIEEVENQLQGAEIPFDGISAYSSKFTYSEQNDEFASLTHGISLNEFLSKKDVENNEKENHLLQQIKEVFDSYVQADKARIEKLERQIRTFSTLQASFTQQLDQKDDVILQYKSQRDRRYKGKINDEIEDNEELFDDLIEIRADLQNTIKKDKQDIAEAEELSFKMQKCIARLFGHTLKQVQSDSDGKKSEVKKLAEVISKSKKINAPKDVNKEETKLASKRILVWATDSNASKGNRCRWQFEREKTNGSIVKHGEKIASIKVFSGRSTVNYDEDCPIYAQSDGKIFFLQENSPNIDENSAVAIVCDEKDSENQVYEWIKQNYEFLSV